MSSSRYSCEILIKLQFSRQILEKYSNIKFNENPSSESRVVPCGETDKQTVGELETTKLMVAFRHLKKRA
jgi:hypothetical protein